MVTQPKVRVGNELDLYLCTESYLSVMRAGALKSNGEGPPGLSVHGGNAANYGKLHASDYAEMDTESQTSGGVNGFLILLPGIFVLILIVILIQSETD
jgi:hypothetical protein